MTQPLKDPRFLQIAALGVLLGVGAVYRDFALGSGQLAGSVAAAVVAQVVLSRWTGKSPSGWPSALVTGLGVAILLRADTAWAHPLVASGAIASKFVIRARGQHVFNPGNLGIVAAALLLPGAWISPGQWGHDVAIAAWCVLMGAAVVGRAGIAPITRDFLLFHFGLLAVRVVQFGFPWDVWTHALGDGALLVFAFFMISDPRTSPAHPRARTLHAALVALLAHCLQFTFWIQAAPIYALFLAAPLVPVWDWLWRAPRYEWSTSGGPSHEPISPKSLPSRAGDRRWHPLPDAVGNA